MDNTIFLADTPDDISRKVMTAYTDPNKIRLSDPGNPDGCVVFAYHKKFAPENVEIVEKECRGGKLGCVAHKKDIAAVIAEFLNPIREKRLYYEKNRDLVFDIIKEGDSKARSAAVEVMTKVREAMHMG